MWASPDCLLHYKKTFLVSKYAKHDRQQLIKIKQDKVNITNERENRGRKEFDNQVDQKILILNKTRLKA